MTIRRCSLAATWPSAREIAVALSAASMTSIICLPALSDTLSEHQKTDAPSAKAANIAAARQVNQTATADKKSADTKSGDGKEKPQSQSTAQAVNQVPGVKVAPKDLESPEAAPIKGFHPIKKMLQPVENLEGMSIKLEQQIVKLEGPIASLQPPMINLQGKMTSVNDTMGKMQTQLNGVDSQMTGVRADLAKMRAEISDLKGPILAIQKPLADVSHPLEAVETQLNLVLFSILVAAIAIVIGTPMAAVLVYRYRDKLFPPSTTSTLPQGQDKTREKVLK
jgi:hypothetical protein